MKSTILDARTIWLIMLALTLLTYIMSTLGLGGAGAVFFLLLTAALKGVFIIRDFMGLRGVSLLWRVLTYGWLIIVIFGISLSYTFSL